MASVDFRNIIIPSPPLEHQAEIAMRVVSIEKSMVSLHRTLAKPVDIINRVFSREFGYNLQEYDIRGNKHTYQKRFTDISKSLLLRSTVKFQHPKYDYLGEIIRAYPWLKLKTLVKARQRIHKGVVPEYSENSEVMVLKTVSLRHSSIDYEACDFVSQEFWGAHREAQVFEGDILVSCHGEGRGKVDIYDKSEPALIDINTAVIPIDPNRINPQYCTYFMQSLLGKFQFELLESETKAVRYMKPESLEQMRIIDLPRTKQDAIVEEIRVELQELHKQKREINRVREQIDAIVMQAIVSKGEE